MKRSIRLCLFTLLLSILALPWAYGQDKVDLAGTIERGEVQVLLKEVPYYVSQSLVVKGTLIIEPGTRIEFYTGGRIIVGTGGRLIADGFAKLAAKQLPTSVRNTGITNYFGADGYASMACFLFPSLESEANRNRWRDSIAAAPRGTDEVGARERTIHPSKYNTIFNVGINRSTRTIVDIDANETSRIDGYNSNGTWTGMTNAGFTASATNADVFIVPFETAILFAAARLQGLSAPTQHGITSTPWSRTNTRTADVHPDTITFIGQPNAPMSDEYGHIIVLPGARAAFFRNCKFESFRKDTIVDRMPFYSVNTSSDTAFVHPKINSTFTNPNTGASETWPAPAKPTVVSTLNREMIKLTNGGGGAITTFSSRTWLVDCIFNKNFAKLRGGAVQILQAPTLAFFNNNQNYVTWDTLGKNIKRYDFGNKSALFNKYVTDHNDTLSTVLTRHSYAGDANDNTYPAYPGIDYINVNEQEDDYFVDDANRAPWDDARVAGYLGRFRNLTFTNNMVRLANVMVLKTSTGGYYHGDDTINAVPYPHPLSNEAAGGAMYIAGTSDEGREIEFGLGINEALGLGSDAANITNATNPNTIAGLAGLRDYIRFEGNSAQNLQNDKNSGGAKGGAIYVGKNTSLIVSGEFIRNFTDAKFLVDTEGDGRGTIGDGNSNIDNVQRTDFAYPTQTYYFDGYNYSRGGAIYSDPNNGRLQVRGGQGRGDFTKLEIKRATDGRHSVGTRIVSNRTLFEGNTAGAGGAIFVSSTTGDKEGLMSPHIGGGPTQTYNNFGAEIKFLKNHAYTAGGAIYTERNMAVYGAGGVDNNYLYTINYLVNFDTNTAGFAGGAVHIEVPSTELATRVANTRVVNLERARFNGNNVNKTAYELQAHINNNQAVIEQVRGGGAMYIRNASLNVVKSTQFDANATYNSNGGAIAVVNADKAITRYFLTDLDYVSYELLPTNHLPGLPGIANSFQSVNNPFTYGAGADRDGLYNVLFPQETVTYTDANGVTHSTTIATDYLKRLHTRMLTKFENNIAVVDSTIGANQISNYGNTQLTDGYIMPDNTFNAQWWFNQDAGFIGGANGWLSKIFLETNKIKWSSKYNHTHNTWEVEPWGKNSFVAMYFHNDNSGFLADNQGDIWKYATNGPTDYTITNVANTSIDGNGYITDLTFAGSSSDAGLATTSNGHIYYNLGGTWSPVDFVVNNGTRLNKVHMVTDVLAYAVGNSGAFVKLTRQGNASAWTGQAIVISGLNRNLTGVFFVNANLGYIIGEGSMMLRTEDGGANWNIVNSSLFAAGETLTDIDFYIGGTGYVISDKGNIYKTTDRGVTWSKLDKIWDSRYSPKSVQVISENTLFVTGAHDLVERSIDGGITWTSMHPVDTATHIGNPRRHGHISGLVENGVGLGGALYVLDYQILNRDVHKDNFRFNRVRIQDNEAFSGSAIYSDNFNLKFKFERSLIRGNVTDTLNTVGKNQNLINGPMDLTEDYQEKNYASSDLVAATVYGEIENAFPNDGKAFSTRANSIFENEARFLIRLPDAPNTKGVLSGQHSGTGYTGVDTLNGNYWGKTEANVGLRIMNRQGVIGEEPYERDRFMTFFIEKRSKGQVLKPTRNYLPYYNDTALAVAYLGGAVDLRRQGPFEYNHNDYVAGADRGIYKYNYIELDNTLAAGNEWLEDSAAAGTIPEKWLFSSDIYDIHDKGLDVKVAEYSERRMFPIEDFAVGNPVQLVLDDDEYADLYDPRGEDKSAKYVKRYIYNPEYSHAISGFDSDNQPIYANSALHNLNSGSWRPLKEENAVVNAAPKYYHPLGMPLYLEAKANWYDRTDINASNFDMYHQSSTVFFIINETTLDYVRVDMKQIPTRSFIDEGNYTTVDELSGLDQRFRATVFFVPDSSRRVGEGLIRRNAEQLRSWGSDGLYPFGDAGPGPQILRALSPRTLDGGFTLEGIETAANNEDFGALHGRKYSVVSDPDEIFFRMGDPAPGTGNPIRELFPNRHDRGTDVAHVRSHMPADNDWRVGETQWDDVADPNHRGTKTTFFAGERYGTLPVNVGDVIRVVSRSVLWKQGPNKAYEGGLVFIIEEGPEAPEFVGDVTMWGDTLRNPYVTDENGNWPITPSRPDANGIYQPDTIKNYDLLNKVFVKTNRWYPWNTNEGQEYADTSRADNDRGTNFILKATAIDRNNFYDPRNLLDISDNDYMGLIYDWSISVPNSTGNATDDSVYRANSGLSRWLVANKYYDNIEVENNEVKGYIEFKGYPINPYIVPGGESIKLAVRNYAPGVEMIDSIKTVTSNGDTISWFYQTFPPYLNAPYYNQNVNGQPDDVARYLQQDTMGARASSQVESEDITIFVMDSLPRFIDYRTAGSTDAPATFRVKEALYVPDVSDTSYTTRNYDWTTFQAGTTTNKGDGTAFRPKYKVNFAGIPGNDASYQLRFNMDLNTDDELEDLAAEQTLYPRPWHFPYGRTAYSFQNVAIHGEEGQDADTSDSDIEFKGDGYEIMQLKPSWMDYEFFYEWTTNAAPVNKDATLLEFQRRGRINFRMDSANVNRLLRRTHTAGEQYNTDTMMSIVCNDGHGGNSNKYIDLYVNFQPKVLDVTLPVAVEGREYNIKRDSNIAIKIYDANQDQRHTFELIQKGDPRTEVVLDPAFPEETRFVFPAGEGWGETPTWLNIDPVSGVLYGEAATVLDLNDTATFITVLVMDEDSLYTIAKVPFAQATGNCPPEIVAIDANMDCIVRGQDIDNSVIVFDRDLIRTGTENETLTLSVNHDGAVSTVLQIEPPILTGPNAADSRGLDTVRLVSAGTGGLSIDDGTWNAIVANNYKWPIEIIVTDRSGSSDTFKIELRIAQSVDFMSKITITNSIGHSQVLEWGVGDGATTGFDDVADKLDEQYCEIEVPPLPPTDVFDARWTIPTLTGIHRSVYPRVLGSAQKQTYAYIATVQPGAVEGEASNNYPVTYQWDITTIPAPSNTAVNPSEACWYFKDPISIGSYFNIRMYDGNPVTLVNLGTNLRYALNGNIATLTLLDNSIPPNFHIIYESHVDVEDEYAASTDIKSVSPSPVYSGQTDANMEFSLAKSGDISIEMFDMLGNKVMTIANTYYPAGSHMLNFNLSDNRSNRLSSGTYTIRLTAGVEVKQFKLIVLQ